MADKFSSSRKSEYDIIAINTDYVAFEELEIPQTPFEKLINIPSDVAIYITKYPFLKLFSYFDIFSFLSNFKGEKSKMSLEDIPVPFSHFNCEEKIKIFHNFWMKEKQKIKPSIINAVYRTFKFEFWIQGFVLFFAMYGRLYIILMLAKITDLILQKSKGIDIDPYEFVEYALIFAVVEFSIKWAMNVINYHFQVMGTKLRQTIVGYTYAKIQFTALTALQNMNIGTVINLLGNNLNELDANMVFIWLTVFGPLTVLIGGYLLWDYYGIFSLVSILGLFGCMALSQIISRMTVKLKKKMNSFIDERIKSTNEFVDCIRLIKLYAWEEPIKKIIIELRNKEIGVMSHIFKYEYVSKIISETSVYYCVYVMCAVYVLYGGTLNSVKVYSAMMILGYVKSWGATPFQTGSNFLASAKVLAERAQKVLDIGNIHRIETLIDYPGKKRYQPKQQDIVINRFSAFWKDESSRACITNLSCTIKAGKTTAIIGKVGSGKTSLLLSFLGELPITMGEIKYSGSVAYVEQEPVIFSNTVRWNILFGQDYDEDLYNQVLKCCNLYPDLAQLPEGDMTLIGEKGVNMSGGQKARISLARALYSQSDIYLLDDPLSAVDSKVARHLYEKAIKGPLLKEKTVILVTHHLSFAKESDDILVLEDGKLVAQGRYDDLINQEINLLMIFKKELDADEPEESERKASSAKSSVHEKAKESKEIKKKKDTSSDVTWQTYKCYLKSTGKLNHLYLIFALYIINQINIVALAKFIGYWATEHENYYLLPGQSEEFDNWPFIYWGFILTLLLSVGKFIKVYMTVLFLFDSNTHIHNMMLEKISRATVQFFDNTPIGTILNRFSGDLGQCDKENSKIFYDLLEGFCYLAIFIFTLCLMNPIVFPIGLATFYFLAKVRNFFVVPAKQCRRLESGSKSPLYSDISQTLNGLCIVRTFRQSSNFIRNFFDLMYWNARAYQFTQRTFRSLNLGVDLSIYILTMGCMFGYMYAAFYWNLSADSFGMAIFMVLELINMSANIMRQSVNIDISMQNAQRMMDYKDLPSEAPVHMIKKDRKVINMNIPRWPPKGEIIFENVFMRYSKVSPMVLNGISLRIPAGTKVGVVGRTGAGKSSLIQCLFRMIEMEEHHESYIKIDGVNISEIGLELLRSNLSIIPQTSVVFTGTIKRNLDPFGNSTDEELWKSLEDVDLKNYVKSLPKGIETDITLSNSVFSVGQKQQICLARAILRKSKILVLDEATANVDLETDIFIQSKVLDLFKNSTIITIAHRLMSIACYDKLIVLDKGKVIEYDSPYRLLVEKEGDSRITSSSLFAEMVQSSGNIVAKKIFDIAQKAYFLKK